MELERLFAALSGPDVDAEEEAEKALYRVGMEAARKAMVLLPMAKAPVRGRLCRIVARVATDTEDPHLVRFVVARLGDDDGKTRRAAAIALGKLGARAGSEVELALVEAYRRGDELAQLRALASALGKVGAAKALDLLSEVVTDDAELTRVIDEARRKIERTLGRDRPSSVDPTAVHNSPLRVRLHVRAGLEAITAEETPRDLAPRIVAPGLVEVSLRGALSRVTSLRTVLRVAFPLLAEHGDPVDSVVRALGSDLARTILSTYARGVVRYRVEWASAGHRRGATWDLVRRVAGVRPDLVNDPVHSPWEVVVQEHHGLVDVEIWPRGLPDGRFAYRRRDVQGASHPTIAAALARVAAPTDGDVAWDPFVGSGTELVELAHLAPRMRLYGTDIDKRALAAAKENLAAAFVRGELAPGDARTHRPTITPTIVVTNPPMGRRVLEARELGPLFEAVLRNIASVTARGARLVWMSPLADRTAAWARAAGFSLQLRTRVDMGGFHAELQAFRRD